MCTERPNKIYISRPTLRQCGVTLVELVMFIVIVGIAVVGILSIMNITTRHSADPMIRKQALAIAESLMEEITLQPFTYCFPDDEDKASIATSASDCSTGKSEDVLPAASRVNNAGARNAQNVADYHNFSINGFCNMEGTPIGGLDAYSASVKISQDARGDIDAAKNDVLRIDVTVTGPGNVMVALTGYRFRYAPRAVP